MSHFKTLNKRDSNFIILFSFIHFFYFLAFLLRLFRKLPFIIIKDQITNSFLFQILSSWSDNHHFDFLFGFFWFFLLIFFVLVDSFRTLHLKLTLLIILYIVFNSACFLNLIFLSHQWLIYLFFITIFSDSFAFFGGKLFGGKLLCPNLSPKKTWSGFFCGILITLIAVLLYYINYVRHHDRLEIFYFIVFIIMSSIVSQFGDLIAS
ncbi:phosphatidate cytidylyltransferase, partial [Candidatus Phytoplasma phoenicium]|uniref:phosphatidate cytidylyltransferase n=1 Tax=Candidatus Phytoplasma phoenicium TaxID=198422 RepID=UPI001EFA8626